MSIIHNDCLFTDTGQMTCLNGSGGVTAPASTMGGWARASGGEPYVENLVAGAVPGTAILLGGFAYHADGRLYVTTEAVAASDQFFDGLRVRADGALRVITSAVDASDTYNGGWAIKQTGEARMSIT